MLSHQDARLGMDRFVQYLRRNGLTPTRTRRRIAELVFSAKRHFTAADLLQWIRKDNPSVGKVTVYRTLSLLVDSGLVAERDFIRNHLHYEPIVGRPHHEHMICLGCKRIIEFVHDEIERLQEEVARHHDFEIIHHIHKLFGYCSRCRRNRTRRRAGRG